ncbi:anthrax toxin-like adenylyl cyclase domain-containing protein [Xenorhabdus bharatensis]|uniref:anthrax toxin-like adenylyl cyclase domain-containing protein n=1 Tax=Xenorhabdus bharatensis TaxID=3136256 RepID=UPI0030F43C48
MTQQDDDDKIKIKNRMYALIRRLKVSIGGILPQHLVAIQKYARKNSCIIGFRPVETTAKGLIREGHPTKSLTIKGKSSSWGMQAGSICINQSYSKLENSPPDIIKKHNNEIQKTLEGHNATQKPLVLTHGRINELLQREIIKKTNIPDSTHTSHTYSAKGPSGKDYSYRAVPLKNKKGQFEIYCENEQLRVLSSKIHKNTVTNILTADYDIFLIAFKEVKKVKNNDGSDDKPKKVEEVKKVKNNDGSDDKPKKHPKYGIVTDRELKIINGINEKIKKEGVKKLIHHGPDNHNPYSNLESNFPAVFVLPRDFESIPPICVIRNATELENLIKTCKKFDYIFPAKYDDL